MKLQLKRSFQTTGSTGALVPVSPTAAQTLDGELSVNYNVGDPALFIKDAANNEPVRVDGNTKTYTLDSGSITGGVKIDLIHKSTGTNIATTEKTINFTGNTGVTLTESSGTIDIAIDGASDIGVDLGYTTASNNGTVTNTAGNDVILPAATQSLAGLMVSTDKTKLDGIESGAEVNVQANYTENSSGSDAYILNKPSWGTALTNNSNTINADIATESALGVVQVGNGLDITGPGVLSVDATEITTGINLGYTTASDNGTVTNTAGNDAILPGATQSLAGLMDSTDKTKLDGIASGAEVNVQANYTESSSGSDAYILNKPSWGTALTNNSNTINADIATESALGVVQVGNGLDITGPGVLSVDATEITTGIDLGYTPSATNGVVTNTAGNDATLSLASTTNAGLLAPADQTKLNNLPTLASGDYDARYVNVTGDNMTGDLTLGTDKITLDADDGNAKVSGAIESGDFASTTAFAAYLANGAVQAFRDSGANPATSPVFVGGRKNGSGKIENAIIYASGDIVANGDVTLRRSASNNDVPLGKYSFVNTASQAASNPERAYITALREESAWGAYLSFATSTGTAAASERLRIDSSGNVGIGTTSIQAKLDVRTGATGFAQFAHASGNGGVRITGEGASSNANLVFSNNRGVSTSDEYTIQLSGADDALVFRSGGTDGTERMRIDSSGRLLVGTSIMAAGCQIIGTGTDLLKIQRSGAGGGAKFRIINGDSNYYDIFHDGAENLTFGYNGNERMRIDSSGRLLVGTSSAVTTGVGRAVQIAQDNLESILVLARNDTSVAAGNTLGRIEFYGNDSNSTYQSCAYMAAEADLDHATGDKPTRLTFATTADGASSPTECFRIDSSGQLLSPNYKSNGVLTIGFDANDNNANNDYIAFVKGASDEKMRITGAGNVGIGTSSPAAKLEINEAATSSTPAKMRFVNSGQRGVTVGFTDHDAAPDFAISSGDQTTHFVSIASSGATKLNTSLEVGNFASTTASAVFVGSGAVQAFRDSGVNAATSPVFIGGRKDGSSSVTNALIYADGSARFSGRITNGPVWDTSTSLNQAIIDNGTVYTHRQQATDAVFSAFQGTQGTQNVNILAEGSAQFVLNVRTGGIQSTIPASPGSNNLYNFFQSKRATTDINTAFADSGGAQVVKLYNNGSAEFASTIQTGGDPAAGTASGSKLYPAGGIRASRPNGTIFAGFTTGSSGATSQILYNGTALFAGTVSAQGSVLTSDQRFKENITDASSQLADVTALGNKLRNWDWTADAPVADKDTRFLGLVAQEAETICPGIVKTIARTKQGAELTPEVVVPAVYETRTVPAVLDDEGEVVEAETTEQVLVTEEQITPATYEELDDSYKGISNDALIMKLLGAVAELSAKVAALEAG